MKKRLSVLPLLLVFLLVFCLPVTVSAATVTASGFYNVGTAGKVTITGLSNGETVFPVGAYINADETPDILFADSDGLQVSLSPTVRGAYYAVTLVEGTALPTQTADFLYTEQRVAELGTITFNVLPELPEAQMAMTLFITSNAQDFQRIAIPVFYTPEETFTAAPMPLPGTVSISEGVTVLTAVLTGTPSAENYDIVWLRNGNPIEGANEMTYAINNSVDNNSTIRVKLVAKGNDYTGEILSANSVTISIGGGGGFGGGGGEEATYAITVNAAEGGKAEASAQKALQGKTITVTVTPNEGYKVSAVTATDAKNNAVAVTESDGVYTFAMPKSAVTVTVTFEKEETEQDGQTVQFADVSDDAYYYDAVLWAVENEITQGVSADAFAPDAGCTRAQIITFLWRAAGSPKAEIAENKFSDVADGDYYYDAVLWAIEKGITSGVTETAFAPNASVDRAQTVTFLWRMAGQPTAETNSAFSDVATDAYYSAAVNWAVAQDITNGTGNGRFSSAAACTRGQIVTFIYRFIAQ